MKKPTFRVRRILSTTSMKKFRSQELSMLGAVLFLSVMLFVFVFFLDSTKDLRGRATDSVATVCNRSCTENRDCLSNMVCWPYGRPSDQKGYCRLDSNPNNDQCQDRQGQGFIVQVYNDLNANGIRDNNEQGAGWDVLWDRNKDESWRPYMTYADKNGEGGRIANLDAGDIIRVRIQGKGGWEVITPTEMQQVMANETTRVAYFGVRQVGAKSTATPKASVQPAITKGGLGGVTEPELVLPSPTSKLQILTSPSPTPTPVVIQQPKQSLGFLGWMRQLFRRFYCGVSKSCTEI